LKRIVAWGLNSDRTAVTDAMCELFAADLRDDLAASRARAGPGTWVGYSQYTDRQKTEANCGASNAKLAGVEIQITDTARHFIMWMIRTGCSVNSTASGPCQTGAGAMKDENCLLDLPGLPVGRLFRYRGVTGPIKWAWRLSVVAGYLLFFLYSIAMTDLVPREIRRRQWLAGSWWTYDRVFGPAAFGWSRRCSRPGFFHSTGCSTAQTAFSCTPPQRCRACMGITTTLCFGPSSIIA